MGYIQISNTSLSVTNGMLTLSTGNVTGDYTISTLNFPEGLTPQVSIVSTDNNQLKLSLIGSANNHERSDSVSNLILGLNRNLFSGSIPSDLGVNFSIKFGEYRANWNFRYYHTSVVDNDGNLYVIGEIW